MNSEDATINAALSVSDKYLNTAICSMSTNPKYSHKFLEFIKTTTQKEDDIYITIVSHPHYFIILYIEDIFYKLKSFMQAYPLHTYLDTMDEKPHYDFVSYPSGVYRPPPPCDFKDYFLDYIK